MGIPLSYTPHISSYSASSLYSSKPVFSYAVPIYEEPNTYEQVEQHSQDDFNLDSTLGVYPRIEQLEQELRELQEAELDIRSVLANGKIIPNLKDDSFHLDNAVLNYSY